MQDLYFTQSQLTTTKQELSTETETVDSLKLKVQDCESTIEELKNMNEDLHSEVLRKNKEFSLVFKEIFHIVGLELIDIKKMFIEEIKLPNKETFADCSELSNSLIRTFNESKFIWLKEKEELSRELIACKYENGKYREMLTEADQKHYDDQQNLKTMIENSQQEIANKEEKCLNTLSTLQSVEKNQSELQNLIQEEKLNCLN